MLNPKIGTLAIEVKCKYGIRANLPIYLYEQKATFVTPYATHLIIMAEICRLNVFLA